MNGVSGAMRLINLDSRSRNLSRVAMIVVAAAASAGCSSDTGRFGGEPVYTGSTPNQRAILGQTTAPAYAPSDTWRSVDTTGSVPVAQAPVVRQDLAQPAVQPAPQAVWGGPPAAAPAPAPSQAVQAPPAPQPTRVAAAGWTASGGSWVTAQSGDTVESLSRRYGVPAGAIAQANGVPAGAALQSGQRLVMPVYSANTSGAPVAPPSAPVATRAPAPVAAAAPATAVRQIPMTKPEVASAAAPSMRVPTPTPAPSARTASAASPVHEPAGVHLVGDYTVRKGDTLASVARTYGVSEQALKERNGLRSSTLQPGQHLLLPAGTRLMLKTSQAPARATTLEAPIPAPVTQVAQTPIARPTMPAAAPSKPLTTASVPASAPAAATRVAAAPAPMPAPAKAAAAKPSAPSAASTAKIDQKAAETIAVAREPAVEEPSGSAAHGSFRWPVRGRVISEFGSKTNGEKNEGINLAVPEGTSVKAADDGEVIYSGNELKGYGNLVLVRHPNGYVTAYAHASELLVNRGDRISRGQIIARAGATGSVNQPQLHFELRKGQRAIDPKPYLASN